MFLFEKCRCSRFGTAVHGCAIWLWRPFSVCFVCHLGLLEGKEQRSVTIDFLSFFWWSPPSSPRDQPSRPMSGQGAADSGTWPASTRLPLAPNSNSGSGVNNSLDVHYAGNSETKMLGILTSFFGTDIFLIFVQCGCKSFSSGPCLLLTN